MFRRPAISVDDLRTVERYFAGFDDGAALDGNLRLVVDALHVEGPSPARVEAIWAKVSQSATVTAVPKAGAGRRGLIDRRKLAVVALAVSLTAGVSLALVFADFGGPGGGSVNAAAVVNQAASALSGKAPAYTGSFAITSRFSLLTDAGTVSAGFEIRRWAAPPDKWRSEGYSVTYSGGSEALTREWTLVGDDVTQWSVNGLTGETRSQPGDADPLNTSLYLLDSAAGGGSRSLAEVLEDAESCFSPQIAGEEAVAGRAAYVVDLGPSRCSQPSGTSVNQVVVVPERIWIDKDTFLVLRWETDSGPVRARYEVTALDLSPTFSADTFEHVAGK